MTTHQYRTPGRNSRTHIVHLMMFALVAILRSAPATGQTGYEEIDRHAIATPASAARSVTILSAYLTRPYARDDEKARAIFCWIAHNIAYDVDGYFSGAASASSSGDVLQSRSSVCAGYSSLFESLAREAGLAVVTINGYAKGFSYQPGDPVTGESNHAWNAVKIRGAWKLVDCTWGAGSVDNSHSFIRNYEPYYFFTDPGEFAYRHLPDDPKWQVLPRPLSRTEFQNLPFVFPVFFECAIKSTGQPGPVIEIAGEARLAFSLPADVRCMADLTRNGVKIDGAVFPQRTENGVQIRVVPPSAGNFILNLYAKHDDGSDYFPIAASYKVVARAGRSDNAFPRTYAPFMAKGVQLQSPGTLELPSGSMQEFRLTVPGAEQVAVVNADEWDFLKKQDDQFDGLVEIGAGDVTVFAKFPHDKEYQALLEYKGTGSIKRAPSPVKFHDYMTTGAELLSPPKKELAAQSRQLFRLKLPGARKAAVVCGDDWQFLQKNGEYYEGSILIGRGQITVMAAYNNTTDFVGLLEYVGY
jgi:hypothetical protein